jgi:hypothetical protein
MKKYEKEVQQAFLNNEEAVIKRLKTVYNKSLADITAKSKELQDEINSINALIGMTEDADEIAQLKSMAQSKVYQKQYQDALKKQVSSILDNMQVEEFKTVSSYLTMCYEEGFVGSMYSLQKQGIPLCFPLDQEAMVRAVQLDSKISEGLYSRLGEDVSLLKKKITAQVSRGIATGMTYQQVAQQIAGYTNIGFNNAVRIARTEGHRIQVQSGIDACYKAKEKGADVVKQWDSTLDGNTRESHQQVDGEIRELDKPFSNGLMFPGDPSGGAAEVVNCRCALLQRARWALDEDELQTLKDRAAYYGLDKTANFEDYKQKYLKAAETEKILTKKSKSDKIELQNGQKKPYTKVKVEDIPSMDETRFNTMKGNLEKQGVAVIQDADGDDFLKGMNAEAITLSDGSAVIFQSGRIPSASAVFEETIHVSQIRKNGMIKSTSAKQANVEYLSREIEANEKLLKHQEAYGLTDKDVESVQENLAGYYEEFKKVNKDV